MPVTLNYPVEGEAPWDGKNNANLAALKAQGDANEAAIAANVSADAADAADLANHTGTTTAAHGGVVASNDSRLTNSRVPTAHASTHAPGGSDPLGIDLAANVASLRTIGTGPLQAAPGSAITSLTADKAVLWESTLVVNSVFQAGIPIAVATTLTGLSVFIDLAPTGAAVIVDWYLKGPSTSQALSAVIATTTINAGAFSGVISGLRVGVQAGDRLIAKLRQVGSTIAGSDLVAVAYYDSSIAGLTLLAPPAAPAADTTGLAAGQAHITWAAVTGATGYTLSPSTGGSVQVGNVLTYTYAPGALPAGATTFTIAVQNAAGTGAASAASNSVSITSSSQRLTNLERMGTGYSAMNNCTIAPDAATTLSGSPAGLTGSLQVNASASGSAEAQLTRHFTVTAGETGIAFSAQFRNDAAVQRNFGTWIGFFNGSGYMGGQDSGLQQKLINAGVTDIITSTFTAPAGATSAAINVQGVMGSNTETYHAAPMSVG